MRIVDLAKKAEVSEPTVVRFCRAVGCHGFQDFKLALAQQLASSPSFGKIAVTDSDSAREYTLNCLTLRSIHCLRCGESLVLHNLEAAVEAIYNANRVEFYGFGSSAAVAFDAQHKFFRLQITSAAYSDPHLQNMSASSLKPNDVVIAISPVRAHPSPIRFDGTGKTIGQYEVIALAPSGTPVTEQASIAIEVNATEYANLHTAIIARIAHLVMIDVLAIGVAQKGPKLEEHLQLMQAGLSSLRSS